MRKICWQRSRFNPRSENNVGESTGTRRQRLRPECRSASQPQALDELLVLLRLRGFQIVEVFAALVDQLYEATARGMVGLVCREMIAQTIDALGQQRDLNFW